MTLQNTLQVLVHRDPIRVLLLFRKTRGNAHGTRTRPNNKLNPLMRPSYESNTGKIG